jgi:uncharacterized lipoprotein
MTYIYLVEIGNNQVYIGKTKNPTKRVSDHRKTYGGHIIYTVIDEINSIKREDWTPLEKYWIEQFRQWGFKIVNPNPNGGGGSSEWTKESKIKQSIILKNRPNTWTTEEIGNKISQGLKEHYKNPENKEKISQGLKEYYKNNKPKSKPKLISEHIVTEIRTKHSQGQRICDLNKEYNVSWGTIKNVIEKLGGYK